MSSIRKTGEGRNAKYTARWRQPDGGSRQMTFTREKDARDHLARVDADVSRGTYVDASNRTTVLEYAEQWVAAQHHRQSTQRRVQTYLRAHIEATPLGARPLAQVKPSEVQAWAKGRSATLAPSTLSNLYGFLRGIFDAAVEDGLVVSNPCTKRVTRSLPKRTKRKIEPLTVQQVRALAESTPARYSAAVLVQAGLGLRIGELLALKVEDIDFLRGTVKVQRQLAPGSTTFTDVLKTEGSRRTVPLPEATGFALAEHIRQYPNDDGLIFSTTFGGPLRHDYYGAQVFARAVLRAGLPAGTTPHALRHHFASVLVTAGVSVYLVADLLGHETPALVLSTYGHLMPDTNDVARKTLNAAWSSVGVGTVLDETAQGV